MRLKQQILKLRQEHLQSMGRAKVAEEKLAKRTLEAEPVQAIKRPKPPQVARVVPPLEQPVVQITAALQPSVVPQNIEPLLPIPGTPVAVSSIETPPPLTPVAATTANPFQAQSESDVCLYNYT